MLLTGDTAIQKYASPAWSFREGFLKAATGNRVTFQVYHIVGVPDEPGMLQDIRGISPVHLKMMYYPEII
ncbi:MAG: hypothetical protein ACXQTG_03940 [Methanoculleaceae archaeon]